MNPTTDPAHPAEPTEPAEPAASLTWRDLTTVTSGVGADAAMQRARAHYDAKTLGR